LDITFNQLKVFHAVVVTGSISKAARVLGLSQPSISQQMSKLEKVLGGPLLVRNRTGIALLTSSGDFWYKISGGLLSQKESALKVHQESYSRQNTVMRLGLTNSIRGKFVAAAVRVSQRDNNHVKFELVYGLNSDFLVEQLRLNKINFAIVYESALADEMSSFKVTKVFEDRMVLAIPSYVTEQEILYAIGTEIDVSKINPILNQYVDVTANKFIRAQCKDWLSSNFKFIKPNFTVPSYFISVEIVAEGLGISPIPLSAIQGIPTSILEKINFYEIDVLSIIAVLAMHKHLVTHTTFSRIFNELVTYCQEDFGPCMLDINVKKFPALVQ
jgi:DNA-binding transcriptional LysR family regulator